MKNIRIIPRLDIKGLNVVKPIQAEALPIVGDPKEMARRYYLDGADELIYTDIVASLYQRSIDFDLLKLVTENIFIPVIVGGGIKSLNDINYALRSGADKVAINTYAAHHPEFISEAAKEFGSQCIVLFVEAKKNNDGTYEVYTDGGRERSGINVIEWITKAVEQGAGEILISSIDQDGTRLGYDIELVKKISTIVPVPVIAHGGAGDHDTIKKVITEGRADAVAVSTLFHYNSSSIPETKRYLKNNGINVRVI